MGLAYDIASHIHKTRQSIGIKYDSELEGLVRTGIKAIRRAYDDLNRGSYDESLAEHLGVIATRLSSYEPSWEPDDDEDYDESDVERYYHMPSKVRVRVGRRPFYGRSANPTPRYWGPELSPIEIYYGAGVGSVNWLAECLRLTRVLYNTDSNSLLEHSLIVFIPEMMAPLGPTIEEAEETYASLEIPHRIRDAFGGPPPKNDYEDAFVALWLIEMYEEAYRLAD